MSMHPNQFQAALSAAQQLANTLSTAATAVNSLAQYLPVDNYLRRRALVALGTRAAWGIVPVVGIGLAVWGVRAWRRRNDGSSETPAPFVPHATATSEATQAHPA